MGPLVWLLLGSNAIYRKEWQPVSRWAPCGVTMDWFASVEATEASGGRAEAKIASTSTGGNGGKIGVNSAASGC
jgi:hypothetical protein